MQWRGQKYDLIEDVQEVLRVDDELLTQIDEIEIGAYRVGWLGASFQREGQSSYWIPASIVSHVGRPLSRCQGHKARRPRLFLPPVEYQKLPIDSTVLGTDEYFWDHPVSPFRAGFDGLGRVGSWVPVDFAWSGDFSHLRVLPNMLVRRPIPINSLACSRCKREVDVGQKCWWCGENPPPRHWIWA